MTDKILPPGLGETLGLDGEKTEFLGAWLKEAFRYQKEKYTKKEKNLLIISKMGRAIKVKASEFPLQKRKGIGITAMVLEQGDEIVAITEVEE